MPLIHIALRKGKPAAYRQALVKGVHQALHDTFNVPEDNFFMTINEHEADNFHYSKTFMDIARSDDLVYIQLTVNNTRTLEQKQALYRHIVRQLTTNPGLRPEDVFINLVEVLPENWSLGLGVAQYAPKAVTLD